MFKKIIIMGFLLLNLNCNTNGPIENEGITIPGKRNYSWSADSIDYNELPGRIELYSIWGSSPNDVWGAGFTEDVRNCLWHFDGVQWSRAVWNTPITQYGDGSKSVGGVWGTANNDVWAFGGKLFSNPERQEPFIMHYNGNQWLEVSGDKTQMPLGYTDIYPIRKNHFWISSSNHVCEYKDGVWKKYSLREDLFIQSIEGIGSSIYLTAYPIGIDTLYLMKYSDGRFNIIDQAKLIGESKFEQNGLLFLNNLVYTFGFGIVSSNLIGEEILLTTWKKELAILSGQGFRTSYGITAKDIWAIGFPGIAYHFNGENWLKVSIGDVNAEATFKGIWGNGSEIFIADVENSVVYHGK